MRQDVQFRGFCSRKKNRKVIDTINVAKLWSTVSQRQQEPTIRPYEYFEHLPTVIPEHMGGTDRSFLKDLTILAS